MRNEKRFWGVCAKINVCVDSKAIGVSCIYGKHLHFVGTIYDKVLISSSIISRIMF